ncbi:hypothetical protein PR202_gb23713 [Eleusine coracana subsp. coracana]|uniref:SAM domain-containing protein n=1 Tax=Eleusine coracana subsp. coracana TaxID=191504 RepID=A0AAV5FK48_ELECO|nr:hypothetical protein PR202_gb23713 [Eleusine coracana subsp. coracana]
MIGVAPMKEKLVQHRLRWFEHVHRRPTEEPVRSGVLKRDANVKRAIMFFQDVGLWLEEINLGSYRQVFEENGVNGEYLESLSMFTTEQILRFIRRCHMKWGDFITLCKELRRIKVACLKGEQEVRRPWWAPSCLSVVFVRAAKRNRQSRVVSLKLEP